MHRAIFVCSGNICRSPMAEHLFARALRSRGLKGAVISMGTLGLQGRGAAAEAVEAMAELGVDISGHGSQGVSLGLLHHATEIFVMERAHRDYVLRADPALSARVVMLGAHDPEGGPEEIADPVGGPIEAFRACRDRLERCIDRWLDDHADL